MRSLISIVALAVLLSSCALLEDKSDADNVPAGGSAPSDAGAAASGAGAQAPGTSATYTGTPGAPPPARATADFNRAVGVMRSGNAAEAELEFKQMTLSYPQLSAPFVNLGILYRKGGRLDQSEEALKLAVERNSSSAVAWNELGVTQRMRGEFPEASASYEKAIGADSNFAPAYRNLGVVSDLYLGDPERALMALERYKELTGEDRPVTSWIAELRQRTGKPPVKPRAPAGAAGSGGGGSNGAADSAPQEAGAAGQSSQGGASGSAPAGAPQSTPQSAPQNQGRGQTPAGSGKTSEETPKPTPKAGGQ